MGLLASSFEFNLKSRQTVESVGLISDYLGFFIPISRYVSPERRESILFFDEFSWHRFVSRGDVDDNTPVKENGMRVSHSLFSEKATVKPTLT